MIGEVASRERLRQALTAPPNYTPVLWSATVQSYQHGYAIAEGDGSGPAALRSSQQPGGSPPA